MYLLDFNLCVLCALFVVLLFVASLPSPCWMWLFCCCVVVVVVAAAIYWYWLHMQIVGRSWGRTALNVLHTKGRERSCSYSGNAGEFRSVDVEGPTGHLPNGLCSRQPIGDPPHCTHSSRIFGRARGKSCGCKSRHRITPPNHETILKSKHIVSGLIDPRCVVLFVFWFQ